MDRGLNRRNLIKGTAGLVIAGSTGGCLGDIFGPEAPELEEAVEQTEAALKTELPWSEYDLEFDVDDLYLNLEALEPTGVGEAYQYAISINIDLISNSSDLEGWLGSEAPDARREEFFSLYAPPTYDMLLETYDNLEAFTAPGQPSNMNRIVEYTIHIGAEGCSYIEDTLPAARVDELISEPQDYLDYLDEGEEVEVVIEDGLFDSELFC